MLPTCAFGQFGGFTEESTLRGLAYQVQPAPQANGLYGFGVVATDLDRDGDDDIVVVGRLDGRIGVFLNDGQGHFADESLLAGLPTLPAASAVLAVDLDGDRMPELLFSQINYPTRIFRNLGGARFARDLLDGTLGTVAPTKALSAADIDGDDDLDLFLANYPQGSTPPPSQRSRLLRNDGTAFVDIAPIFGLDAAARSFLGIFSDVDLDGDPDLYISNDRGHLPPLHAGNRLWLNERGVFVPTPVDHPANVACFSMGVACGDFDGTGTPDFLVTNIPSVDPPVYGVNPLLLGIGDGTFVRSETVWDVEDLRTGWGALFLDVDNSGTLDLFVNHQGTNNALWLNPGRPPAVEVPDAGGATGVPNRWNYSTATADFDGDGDLDLVSLGLGANLRLYINHSELAAPSTQLRLEGVGRNTDAIGATVRAAHGGRILWREIQAGGVGYLGQNSHEIHLGHGAHGTIARAVVRFPDGCTRAIGPLPPGRFSVVHSNLLADANADGIIDEVDSNALEVCLSSGGRASGPCSCFDFDADLAVTRADAERFMQVLAHFRADLVADRRVDAQDLSVLLEAWGGTGPADLDAGGTVGTEDLALLLESWGERP